jgi:hypothetical protein
LKAEATSTTIQLQPNLTLTVTPSLWEIADLAEIEAGIARADLVREAAVVDLEAVAADVGMDAGHAEVVVAAVGTNR